MRKSKPKEQDSKPRKRRRLSPWWSIVWLIVWTLLYANRSDWNYVVTVWPAWTWGAIGFVFALFARKGKSLLVALWLLFALIFVDEAKSYPRMIIPSGPHDLRVVSLNCAGGTVAAAQEIKAYRPDIVLLQESPDKDQVAKLAKEFFGDEGVAIPGPDASIIVRGPVTPVTAKYTNDFVGAHWKDSQGHSLDIVSLRLLPPCMRIDFFNPEAWQEFSRNRSGRRKEVAEMATKLADLGLKPDLIGGDWNTPPDIGVQRLLVDGLGDTFAQVGRGYGATCVNPYPCLVRIDQIWHSSALTPVNAFVVKTENSDHRMLVADFRWSR